VLLLDESRCGGAPLRFHNGTPAPDTFCERVSGHAGAVVDEGDGRRRQAGVGEPGADRLGPSGPTAPRATAMEPARARHTARRRPRPRRAHGRPAPPAGGGPVGRPSGGRGRGPPAASRPGRQAAAGRPSRSRPRPARRGREAVEVLLEHGGQQHRRQETAIAATITRAWPQSRRRADHSTTAEADQKTGADDRGPRQRFLPATEPTRRPAGGRSWHRRCDRPRVDKWDRRRPN
jgi:hypothetical protein